MALRITQQDLLNAAEWCESYEGEETDPTAQSIRKVAVWLELQARKRMRQSARRLLKKHNKDLLKIIKP